MEFQGLEDITLTVRHIEYVSLHNKEEGDMRFACRASNGAKVWITLEGITPGEILNMALIGAQMRPAA